MTDFRWSRSSPTHSEPMTWQEWAECFRKERDALQQRVEALEAIVKATIVETAQGQPCYRSAGGVPMGMPPSVERLVRKHQATLRGGGTG